MNPNIDFPPQEPVAIDDAQKELAKKEKERSLKEAVDALIDRSKSEGDLKLKINMLLEAAGKLVELNEKDLAKSIMKEASSLYEGTLYGDGPMYSTKEVNKTSTLDDETSIRIKNLMDSYNGISITQESLEKKPEEHILRQMDNSPKPIEENEAEEHMAA